MKFTESLVAYTVTLVQHNTFCITDSALLPSSAQLHYIFTFEFFYINFSVTVLFKCRNISPNVNVFNNFLHSFNIPRVTT